MVAEDLVQLDERRTVLLEPAREALVQLRARRLCQGVVGGVADEQVAEAEGVLARELRRVRPDQPFAHERGESRRHLRLVRPERLHGAAVEELALDGAALEHAALARLELVEARGEERTQRRRDDDVRRRVAGHREHLRDEEWVAAGGSCDPVPQLGAESRRKELLDVLGGQRLQPERHGPLRALLEQLRPRHAGEEDRRARREERDVLDQVEERLLAPVDIVEDDRQWVLGRRLLERLADGPGDLLRRRLLLRLPEQRADRGRRRLVVRDDAELLQDLDDRPVGDPLAVGETAAADDLCVTARQSLVDQARLADARLGDDRDELAAALHLRSLPGLSEQSELALPADETRLVSPLRRCSHAQEQVGGDRLALPFERERLDLLHLDRVAHERERRRTKQDVAGLRRLLESGSDVDRVSRREPLLRARDHLPGVDADPGLDLELGQRVAHLGRRPHRPQRVVLVRDRHAEHRHHRVADELLHRPAVALDDRLHPLEVAGEQGSQGLRIHRLAKGSRAGDVAEENGDGLPLNTCRLERRPGLDSPVSRPAGVPQTPPGRVAACSGSPRSRMSIPMTSRRG